MNKKMSKRQRDLKTKLMAAICMLLVSSIMMVSTTYAWFTLSTAPEVTGITTAVGANGNLEMALLPKTGDVADITSEAGDSVKNVEERNVTWGNLVDLSDTTVYGLDKITLFPSALNAATEDSNKNPLTLETSMLKTPTYGADGRVSELVANTFTGYYNSVTGTFAPDDQYGVRAVGTASGMTDRQLDYRNARSAANTATSQAASLASQSLNNNGSALANIAITHGMGSDEQAYTAANVASLRSIINDLQNGVLPQIERAYMQYILAYAASAASGEDDTVWQAVKGAVTSEGATLSSVTAVLGSAVPGEVSTAIEKYNATVADVAEADAALDILEAELDTDPNAKFDWAEIRDAMTPLANAEVMKVNGFEVKDVKTNLGELVSSITAQGGLIVTMPSGGGVYADIADQCGDYTASVTIERVEYNGIVLNNMKARMETDTSLSVTYLAAIGSVVERVGAPSSGATGTLPISDMYGYIIDMAFRTNAAESNLLLQVEAADRIYTDNTNEQTMGHGSSMTFKATTTDFSDDQVKALMNAIRIVFFDKGTMKVVATAKLDTATATYGTDGWTAEMYMYTKGSGSSTTYSTATYEANSGKIYYKMTAEEVYTKTEDPANAGVQLYVPAESGGGYTEATYDADATGVTYYTKSTQDKYTALTDGEAAVATEQLYIANSTDSTETRDPSNIIMPLTQNTAHTLSALVYLDGENVTNADVAATANTSMTGKMSLQFASSANLVPMEYAALYQGSGNNTNGGTPETTEATTAPTETPEGG